MSKTLRKAIMYRSKLKKHLYKKGQMRTGQNIKKPELLSQATSEN